MIVFTSQMRSSSWCLDEDSLSLDLCRSHLVISWTMGMPTSVFIRTMIREGMKEERFW